MLKAMQTDQCMVFDEHGNPLRMDMSGFAPQDVYGMIFSGDGQHKCQLFINENDETDQVWVKL